MTAAQRAVDSAISEADRLRKILRKNSTKQVKSDDEKRLIKATAFAWFNSHRALVASVLTEEPLVAVDATYKLLLAASGSSTTRRKYVAKLKRAGRLLAQLQADQVVSLSAKPVHQPDRTADDAPSFGTLVADSAMQQILTNRWQECVRCLAADAPLAATVMVGGILEGLLLARINQLTDKSPVFKATLAPKDRKTGNPLKLGEWGLKNYIDVAHEIGWISQTAKDLGEVLRDYRNVIHPQKQHSQGINLSADDARMLWEVAKNVLRQLLKP